MTNADLDSLMTRLADGDRSVFRAVFDRLWSPTLRFCSRILDNEADAADAAQQALTKILERASDYDGRRPAMPWALAIAGWECRTLLRSRVRRRESPAELAPDPVEHDHDVEERVAARQLARAAVEAMGQLSDRDREVLEATFREEASNAGGATERKRRERALARLRTTFRRLYGIG